jgi:glutamate racemase
MIQKMLSTSCSMMDDRPILFFDSGVGGLPYLALAIEKLPEERFVYLADRKYFPYGEKEPEAIKAAVFEAFEKCFRRIDPKCVVVACNTATVVALADLRKKYTMPFVGVVPAVKPAATTSTTKKFGVLATQRTVSDAYLKNLIDSFANQCDVYIVPAPRIVDVVERHFFSTTDEEKTRELASIVENLKNLEVDTVVLGCTHFLLIIDLFKKVLGTNVSVLDSREGVVNQLARIIKAYGFEASRHMSGNGFYVTGSLPIEPQYELFADKFGLRFEGLI